jgi:hypothetical protein
MNQYKPLYAPNVVITYSGILFNFKDPVVENVYAQDIAVALARECRFGGGTKKFYSVAEHSVWMALEARNKYPHLTGLPFKALLHDAHEAYLKDIPSPIKSYFAAAYSALAEPIQKAIHIRFGITVSDEERKALYSLDQDALEWEWDNKVLKFTGISFPQEEQRAGVWLEYFRQWCRVPHCVTPKESVID